MIQLWNLCLWLLFTIGGFLLGGVMFSQLIPKLVQNKDIQAISDDHNPGATNVFVNCGVKLGILCLVLDMAKGFLPIFLACRLLNIDNMMFAIVLAAPVLGHAVAPFYHFHGGKCIATAFGEMLALLPYNAIGALLALLYILFSTVFKISPNRVRSLITFGLFGLISVVLLSIRGQYSVALGCFFIALIAVVKHSKYFCR